MNKSTTSRFNFARAAIGIGVGAALCASSGYAIGITTGIGLAIVFGFTAGRKC
jgi:hypothetical protein